MVTSGTAAVILVESAYGRGKRHPPVPRNIAPPLELPAFWMWTAGGATGNIANMVNSTRK